MANTYKVIDEQNWKRAMHSFVDGIHIGQFAEKLQKYLNEF